MSFENNQGADLSVWSKDHKITHSYEDLTLFGQQSASKRIATLSRQSKSMGSANIPERYKQARLVTSSLPVEVRKSISVLYKAAKNYVNEFTKKDGNKSKGMLLYGGTGSGKTHVACAIGNVLSENGVTILYTTSGEMAADIAAAKSFSSKENELMVMEKYAQPDLLVIDELRSSNSLENNIIFNVIDQRYRANKPIIGISNLSPEKLKLAIGEMSVSRIVGHGGEIMHFDQEDLRCLNFSQRTNSSMIDARIPCVDEETSLFKFV